MVSFKRRIKNKISITAGRVRHEWLKKPLSEKDLQGRLVPVPASDLPAGEEFWPALYDAFLKSCPDGLRVYDQAIARDRQPVLDNIMAGKITVLGREIDLPADCGWNTELFFNVPWERKYYKALADKNPGSDLVLLWMPNRMLHLLDLSYAYAVTRDEAWAREWVRQAVSWCESNPYLVGMNWRSPLEIGIRLWVWSLGLRELAGSPSLDSRALSVIIPSLVRQADHLAANFSYWKGTANNHLIGEAATLYAFASMWNILDDAAGWKTTCREVMGRELDKQILPDGFSYENAVNYHLQVVDFTLLYLLLCHLNGETIDSGMTGTMEKMVTAILTLISPHGRLPRFGDESCREFLIINSGDRIEQREQDDVVFLSPLLKPEFRAVFQDMAPLDPILSASVTLATAQALPASGFAVARSRGVHLAYSAGICHDQPVHPGHLHSDLATFELELDGSMAIVDSGTYLYFRDAQHRRHFRGTRAHNTVMVDGRELMDSRDTFTWRNVNQARGLLQVLSDNGIVICSRHRLAGADNSSFNHTRIVIRTNQATHMIIDFLDELKGGEKNQAPAGHEAEIFFHTPIKQLKFAEGGSAVQFRLKQSASTWRLAGWASGEYRMNVITDPDDIHTWYSPAYGSLETGGTIISKIPFTSRLGSCHLIYNAEANPEPPRAECGPDQVAVSLTGPGGAWRCRLDPLTIYYNDEIVHQGPIPSGNSSGEPKVK